MALEQPLWLEVDGVRVGELTDLVIDKAASDDVWGPIYVHHRRPQTCTLKVKGVPQPGDWAQLVDEAGIGVHEVKLLKIDIQIGLGSALSTIRAELIKP